ncbi:MAG TPA: helix-turn-helix transcriptional regulator [Pelobium sp.]|nr:helix-turn-helix transcriptional regulator [Pelobium sp.]
MEIAANYQDLRIYHEIEAIWKDVYDASTAEPEFPKHMVDSFMTSLIAEQSKLVVQVFDMKRFKSIYISDNIEDLTGYTPDEVNNWGVWAWLKHLTYKELIFQVKNSQLISRILKNKDTKPFLHSYLINTGITSKAGEEKRMIFSNFTISLNDSGKQKYHLILWKEATHLFKTKQVYVRHLFGQTDPTIWSYHTDKGKFLNHDLISERETEIVKLLLKGKNSKEIAEQLSISSLTVDNHRKNIINRLQLKNTDNLLELSKWIKLV